MLKGSESVSCFSRVQLFVTLWTIACQALLSMGFPRQEHCSGLLFPSPGDLFDPGSQPRRDPRDRTCISCVSCIGKWILHHCSTVGTGKGDGSPLQYSCLGSLTDRRAWQAIVHEVTRVGHDLVTKPPPPPWLQHCRWCLQP